MQRWPGFRDNESGRVYEKAGGLQSRRGQEHATVQIVSAKKLRHPLSPPHDPPHERTFMFAVDD